MPFPWSIHIGNQTILVHGIMEFIGIFVAFRYYLLLKRNNGDHVSSLNRLFVVTAATFGAVLGSHLIGSLENIPDWRAARSFWFYLYGNKTLVGGLLGGLVLVELTKKMIGERSRTGDLFVFPLLLGMIIGRIGCFSAGIHEQTYGLPTTMPWAMDLGDGVARHPVVLYEILFLIMLWLALAQLNARYTLAGGALFKLFLISYLAFRFLLDFIKPGWRYCLGLGTIQLTCLSGLIYYARYIIDPRLLITSKRIYAG